jgi:hypothetical protein
MSERSERIIQHGAQARSAGAVTSAPLADPTHTFRKDTVQL